MNKELKYKIYVDLYRCNKKTGIKSLLKTLRSNVGFRYIFLMRFCNYFLTKKTRTVKDKIISRFLTNKLRKMQIKYGIEIPHTTQIGEGLFIPHCGGIVLHGNVKMGKNCIILQGVTIGNNIYKSRDEVATFGDNVTISAGAKIIGPVTIGSNVTIGANAVVTKDIEPGCIVAGIPAKVVAKKDSIIFNTDYLSREDYFKLH